MDGLIPSVVQYRVLRKHLLYHGKRSESKAHIEVFHCLEMKHPACEGTQRIRCFPFNRKDLRFHGRNILPPVLLVPSTIGREDFRLSNPEHCAELYFARVLLFFKIILKSDPPEEKELAFIKYFDRYKVQGDYFRLAIL